MFIPHYRKWFQEQQLLCDEYDDKIQFLFAIKIHGNLFDKYFLIINALHCILLHHRISNFKFQQEQNLVILLYLKSWGFGLNLEKHFLMLFLNNGCEIEN